MIPKIIHYCWFGQNPLPKLAQACIASWKKYCPDYKIMEWNENNFDIDCCSYVKEAYNAKKWAFVSDYARLWALVTYGGIYLDTDCELVKPIDEFLSLEAVSGFQSTTEIQTAIIGCRQGFPFFRKLLERYETRHFILANGQYDLTTNVKDITDACLNHGFVPNGEKQTVLGFTLYPRDWFCPMDWESHKIVARTNNTYAIHHFDASWKTPGMKAKEATMRPIVRFLPRPAYDAIRSVKHKLLGG